MPFIYYFIWYAQHGLNHTEACCRWGVEEALKIKQICLLTLFSLHMCVSVNVSSIIYTILPKVLGRPLLMNRFDYFSHFYEYKTVTGTGPVGYLALFFSLSFFPINHHKLYNPKSEKVGTVWKTQIKKESSDF